MSKFFPVAVALVVVGIGTYYQGVFSERWGKVRTEELAEFSERLKQVPTVIGDWEGTDQFVKKEEFAASNCDSYVSREYRNRRNGEKVSVFLVSGTGRHVTIHTPDWCYRAAGYEMDKDAIPYEIDVKKLDVSPEFRTATFTKHEVTGTDRLRIFWSFSGDGTWKGPKRPKPMYGVRPAMFKMYLITKAVLRRESPEDSASIDFAKEFIPVINEILFANGPTDDSVATVADNTKQG